MMTISERIARRVLLVVATILIVHSAQANTAVSGDTAPPRDSVLDYSHILGLTVSGQQGVVALRLPQAVYLHSRSAALYDLRVFDANGARQAFALTSPHAPQRTERRSWPVRIFPLESSAAPAATGDALDLEISTGPGGTLVSVKTKGAKSIPESKQPAARLAGLVLDLSQIETSGERGTRPLITALRFALPPGLASYSAQVWLDVSDDLKHWNTVGASELSWLVNHETQVLASDRLEFEARSFRYARLSWRSGEPLLFSGIDAESIVPTGSSANDEKLLLQALPGKVPGDLMYSSHLAIPVEKAGLQFAEPNVILPAALGEYRALPSRQIGQPVSWNFQAQVRATFYQIMQQGETRRSGDLALPITHRAEWVVRPQIETVSKPQLRISWQPATLVFLAAGRPPYTLAFGRDHAVPTQLELTQVAPGFSDQELSKLEQASIGELRPRPTPAPDDAALGISAGTRMLILWAVLLLGVAVLCAMGWRLFKQMK